MFAEHDRCNFWGHHIVVVSDIVVVVVGFGVVVLRVIMSGVAPLPHP